MRGRWRRAGGAGGRGGWGAPSRASTPASASAGEEGEGGGGAAFVGGGLAMVLGIVFKDFNASFLVGWAFNVAASANLPSLVMLLFWRGRGGEGRPSAGGGG